MLKWIRKQDKFASESFFICPYRLLAFTWRIFGWILRQKIILKRTVCEEHIQVTLNYKWQSYDMPIVSHPPDF